MDAASGAAASCEPSVPPREEKKKKKASQDGQISKEGVNPPRATSGWENDCKERKVGGGKNVRENHNQTLFHGEERKTKL